MARGKLRVYLGAAPGVGKTVDMLSEGHRRNDRGTDVVVGLCETHGRPYTATLLGGLEQVPLRELTHRGTVLREMDVDAVLARKPDVVLVDELAHTNAPGGRHPKRWQDVEDILEAGINVISTVNIQHLESLNDVVEAITGVRQQETVPDEVVRTADQIELVDMSPHALRRRLAHGNVYAAEKVDAALANYFREGNLSALRELSLLWVADRVEEGLDRYRADHSITEGWPTRERVVVALTGDVEGRTLLRRAAQIASKGAGGELLAVHVTRPDGLIGASLTELDRLRQLTAELGGTFHTVLGEDTAEALLDFARGVNARQIVIGASRRPRWQRLFSPGVGQQVVVEAGDIDVHLVSHELTRSARLSLRVGPALGVRRSAAGWLLATVGTAALTGILHVTREWHDLPLDVLLYLLLTVVSALTGGIGPALGSAIVGSFALNWFFTPPYFTFTISESQHLAALLVFVLVGLAVSSVVHVSDRRAAAARAAQREADALAQSAESLLGERDQLPALMRQVVDFFAMDSAAVIHRTGSHEPWQIVASTPGFTPADLDGAPVKASIDESHQLVLVGHVVTGADSRLVSAFVGRAATLLRRDELVERARLATVLAKDNRARTALLAAVSHDLRTPLAGIKAAVSSLRQREVAFTREDEESLLETIEQSTDRLTALVTNVLDMSRLQSGSVTAREDPLDVRAAISGAAAGLPDEHRLRITVDPGLPHVLGDAGLLDRVLANVLENALRHDPSLEQVVVRATATADVVQVRVVDRGPGVPEQAKDVIFAPFQRYGDAPRGSGVGLGLAVARGLLEVMGGGITAEDTPGGGLTIVLELRRAATASSPDSPSAPRPPETVRP